MTLRPAEAAPALLCECYDHGRDNTPPRNDTHRRQLAYRAPRLPLAGVRAALNSSRSSADQPLLEWLSAWQTRYLQGISANPDELSRLRPILAQCSLSPVELLRVGVAMDYLEGDAAARPWFAAGIDKASDRTNRAESRELLDLLPQTAALWRLSDLNALSGRFAIEKSLNPPLSQAARKAAGSWCEVNFYQGHYVQAADGIAALLDQQNQAGDLTPADRYEIEYILGLYNYMAKRYEIAIPHLIAAADPSHRDHYQASLSLLMQSLAHEEDQPEKARAWIEQYAARYGASSEGARRLEKAVPKYRRSADAMILGTE